MNWTNDYRMLAGDNWRFHSSLSQTLNNDQTITS